MNMININMIKTNLIKCEYGLNMNMNTSMNEYGLNMNLINMNMNEM